MKLDEQGPSRLTEDVAPFPCCEREPVPGAQTPWPDRRRHRPAARRVSCHPRDHTSSPGSATPPNAPVPRSTPLDGVIR